MGKEKLLISSCLLGNNVKYNGGNNILNDEILKKLGSKYELVPYCPEVEGGLPTPRVPCEITSRSPIKVINKNKEDKTKEFYPLSLQQQKDLRELTYYARDVLTLLL